MPELRKPKAWEAFAVQYHLASYYKKKASTKKQWVIILEMIALLALLLGIFQMASIPAMILWCLVLLCTLVFLVHFLWMQKNAKNYKPMLKALKNQEYLVASAWIRDVHSVTGKNADRTYGLAHVRLDSGQNLKREYILPYKYAKKLEDFGIKKEQRALLIYIPELELYRVSPVVDSLPEKRKRKLSTTPI